MSSIHYGTKVREVSQLKKRPRFAEPVGHGIAVFDKKGGSVGGNLSEKNYCATAV